MGETECSQDCVGNAGGSCAIGGSSACANSPEDAFDGQENNTASEASV